MVLDWLEDCNIERTRLNSWANLRTTQVSEWQGVDVCRQPRLSTRRERRERREVVAAMPTLRWVASDLPWLLRRMGGDGSNYSNPY